MTTFTENPRICQNPNRRVPLVALIFYRLDAPAPADIIIDNGKSRRTIHFNSGRDPAAGLPLVGMRAGTEHKITLTVGDSDPVDFRYTTPPLPANSTDFPPIKVVTSNPSEMEPGYTFLSVRRTVPLRAHWATARQLKFEENWGMIVALDAEGEVVWYYQSDARIAGVHLLANGNLFFHHVDFRTIEMDICGNVINQFHASRRPGGDVANSVAIDADSLHHQPHEMPNGNFLALTANARKIDDYYTDIVDPEAPRKTQRVVGDKIVEFTPTGKIVWDWNTFDYLDTKRVGYGLLEPYWWVRGYPRHLDWTHGNGVAYDAHDDSVIVSLRHQDAILKIDRSTKEIVWILGDHAGWNSGLEKKLLTRVGDFGWPYHGHNPRITGEGTFIMYDNGIVGAIPPEPRKPANVCFARGVEFQVDRGKLEVREIWSSATDNPEDRVISWAMGDAHRLPDTGNMLIIDSCCLPPGEALNRSGSISRDDLEWKYGERNSWHVSDYPCWARIREFKAGSDDVAFEVHIDDEPQIISWQVYGGSRAASLYRVGVN